MTPERWARIKEIFGAALEKPEEERSAWLDAACGADASLRQEVERLLAENRPSTLEGPLAGSGEAVATAELSPGEMLAHNRVEAKLGEGGMGAVYRAHDTHLDRPVALKVLPPGHLADPERKRRLLREARAASALNHPNIITIYDIASDRGVDFIAMEFVEGRSLDRIIPAGGLPLEMSLDYSIQIAAGLAKAHGVGIIHRDLKPSNIMVTGDGLAKLLDFGLARRVRLEDGQSATFTTEGEILGTACYMSPEQAQGKRADTRSDIFSFGAVLYEMLSGRRAYRGGSVFEILESVVHEEPAPLAGLPPELETLVARCLRKNPARRFQLMEDVRLVLEELKEECESGRLARAARTRPAPAKRKRVLLGAAALVVLAGAILAWYLLRPGAKPEFKAVPLTFYPGREYHPSFSPEGNQVAFCWDGEKQQNFDIYVKLIGPGEPLRLTRDPAPDISPAWSPDGRFVAFLRCRQPDRAGVYLVPALGGAERQLAEVHTPGQLQMTHLNPYLAWSPDSNWLVVPDLGFPEGSPGLFLLSVVTGEKHRLTSAPPPWNGDVAPAFSPDGRTLAFVRIVFEIPTRLHLLSLSESLRPQGEPESLAFDNRLIMSPVWMPDGRRIVFSSGDLWGERRLWRVEVSGLGARAGQAEQVASVGEGACNVAISRDGRRLAYTRHFADSNIWRVEVAGSGRRAGPPTKLIASTWMDNHPRFSPDGSKIAFQSSRSGSYEIWVCGKDGSNAVQLTFFGRGLNTHPSWSPDGKRLVFVSCTEEQGDIYVISAEGGRPQRLTDHPANDSFPSWSRNGRWIYFTSNRTGDYQVWKMPAEGGEAIQVTRKGGFAAFESHDGKEIFYSPRWVAGASLSRVAVDGGEERQVLESLANFSAFAVVDDGIYFIPGSEDSIQFRSFSSGEIKEVCSIERPVRVSHGFSASPDGRQVLYTLSDRGSDLMLVDDFR